MEIRKVSLINSSNAEKLLSIGSGCVIINSDKVLLVRGKGGDKFKFPGGHIQDDETFKESAKREVLEEISCTVEIVSEPVFYLFKASDTLDIILVHYLANIIEGVPKPTTEIEEVKWFNLNEIPKEVFDNVSPVLEVLKKSIT